MKDGGSNVLGEGFVNNFGDYIVPGVDPASGYQVGGKIEAATVGANVAFPGTLSQRVDLVFKQHAPEITGLVGNSPAGLHWTAAVGDLVKVKAMATDRDGDPLHYYWLLPDGTAVPNAPTGDTISFQLPNHGGLFEFTALVSDNRGGYAKESFTVSTDGVRFGGTVAATNAPVLAGAEIEINGKTARSDADGHFALFVPESTKYVLNIRKAGYGLVSRVYDNGLTGGHWTLTRASVDTVDPTQLIDVTNKRQPGDCPGSLSDRQRDKEGYHRECGPGIRVRIPANSLVDSNGQAPNGSVQIELTTVDLRAPDAMPGDWTAQTQNGDVRDMESYGAGGAEITANGTKYNLKPGATADVLIPIDSAQLAFPANIPNSIPLLSYDEKKGVWIEEGVAQRVGNAFAGKVKHFSYINGDTLKVNQACIRLETVLLPPQFNLEATIPQTSGPPKVKTALFDNGNQRFHVVFNLPTGQIISFRVFDTNNQLIQLIDVNNLAVPITQLDVNSQGPQNPTTPNHPDFPYGACQVSTELTPFHPAGQAVNEFLHGLFSFDAENLTELDGTNPNLSQQFKLAGTAYYKAVDPLGKRDTLDHFKTRNGFPTNEISFQYANSGDLGFGRSMHCRQVSTFGPNGEYACYVTNYGNRFTDDGQDYLDALQNTQPVATVGMEYSRVEDPNDATGNTLVGNPIVKFYVFKEATGNQVAVSANLDGTGERPVPQLCMVCHGGHYPNALQVTQGVPAWTNGASADLGSHYIPFDQVNLFMLNPNGATNQTKMRQLNCDIVRHAAPSTELSDVIAGTAAAPGMYGPNCAGNQQIGFFVPGWADPNQSTPNLPSKVEVYGKLVTPSCRSCHVSQAPSSITWANATDFQNAQGSIASRVCVQHVMPHALVTHNRFWLSTNPHQPLLLNNFLNGNDPPGQGTAVECVQQ